MATEHMTTLSACLVVNLLRFEHQNGRINKISTRIVPSIIVDPSNIYQRSSEATEMIYKLRSVVCNYGISPNAGHYAVFTKDSYGWIRCSDEDIRPVVEAEMIKETACTGYLFFYEKTLKVGDQSAWISSSEESSASGTSSFSSFSTVDSTESSGSDTCLNSICSLFPPPETTVTKRISLKLIKRALKQLYVMDVKPEGRRRHILMQYHHKIVLPGFTHRRKSMKTVDRGRESAPYQKQFPCFKRAFDNRFFCFTQIFTTPRYPYLRDLDLTVLKKYQECSKIIFLDCNELFLINK